jgi:hypothetical protein
MNTRAPGESYTGEVAPEPLSHLAKNQAVREALLASARKGGAMVIRGRELQATGALFDEHSSFMLEGLLMQVSNQATHRAQVLNYKQAGLTPYEIIKAIWHVEDTDSPEYRAAYHEYQEAIHPHKRP